MKKATSNCPSRRSPGLLVSCETADRAVDEAHQTYDRKDYAVARDGCLKASLLAYKEGNRDWADEYGKKSAAMNRKACGG